MSKNSTLSVPNLSLDRSPGPGPAYRILRAARREHESCAFGRWAQTMSSGNFEAAWRINDTSGAHWPSAHKLFPARTIFGAHAVVKALHGLGDAVQMLGYVPSVQALTCSVRFEVPADLQPLLPYFLGVDTAAAPQQTAADPQQTAADPQQTAADPQQASADPQQTSSTSQTAPQVEVEMMELPYLFRTSLDDLPLTTDYLALPNAVLEKYRERLHPISKRRVGLIWSGGDWDRDRWLPLDLLAPLVADSERTCEWWNLQGYPAAIEASHLPLLRMHSSDDDGLLALAASIATMDLIVTVDTLAAHLAGALGKATWLMLKHHADWRWLTARLDSPWYPSLRLFRQPTPGDWTSVVQSVRRALRTES